MTNMEGVKIKRQFVSKILPPKLFLLTEDIPTPLEYFLGNNLNDRIGNIEKIHKMLQTCSPYYKNLKKHEKIYKKQSDQKLQKILN